MAKLVEGARKLKAMLIGPYLFHLYMGQEALNGEEMVAYEIGLDLLKYNWVDAHYAYAKSMSEKHFSRSILHKVLCYG